MTAYCALAAAVIIAIFASNEPAAANDCHCPTVRAFGKGNTSCSSSETDARCIIDYNLFSPLAEGTAAEMLRTAGLPDVKQPPPGLPIQALAEVGRSNPENLVDYVLVYLFVAVAEQKIDFDANLDGPAKEIVNIVAPLRPRIQNAFAPAQMEQWLSDDRLRQQGIPSPSLTDDRSVLAPGCFEVRAGGLWAMFKASWSPMRIRPRCGR
jgi:hypothetical protein